jgi:uncharacterized protein
MRTSVSSSIPKASQSIPNWLLILGLLVPTFITYIYFDLLSNASPSVQKGAYVIGKGLQFVVLVAAIWRSRQVLGRHAHQSPEQWGPAPRSTPKSNGIVLGLASGFVIGACIVGVYQFLLLPSGIMLKVKEAAVTKVSGLGIDSPMVLVAIGLFYSLIHSGFEELYWRGFVYRALLERVSLPIAVAVSSLAFMSHHVIVLAKYFSYSSPLTYIASLGVAVGGTIWAWMWSRYRSLIPGWISHALVDAAIFMVAYLLLFQ